MHDLSKHEAWEGLPKEQRNKIMDFFSDIDFKGVPNNPKTRNLLIDGIFGCIEVALNAKGIRDVEGQIFEPTKLERSPKACFTGALESMIWNRRHHGRVINDKVEESITDNLEKLYALLVKNAVGTRSKISKV